MSSSEESDTDNFLKNSSLPQKSKQKYLVAYQCFMRWKTERNEDKLDEDVFLIYFTELAKARKPSSLWAQYSMLKATMRVKHQVFMQNYVKLLSFLKKYTVGFKSEKSKILTESDILQFVQEAPDEYYLVTKVALIIGVSGACKIFELTDLTVNDIKTHGELMLVRIRSSEKADRMFIVRDEFVPVVKKYQALRPRKVPTDRFFVNYRAGQCTRQVIGRNKLCTLPKQIASYLKLPNPERYTGHCFRRSALVARSTSMTVNRPRLIDYGAEGLKGQASHAHDEAENSNHEVEIKVEEIDAFGEEPMFRNDNEFPMEFNNDFKITSQGLQPSAFDQKSFSDVINTSNDISEQVDDSFDMNKEKIRTIDLSSLQNHQSGQETGETNINVAGNNINISFKNCAHVGNITVNIINK